MLNVSLVSIKVSLGPSVIGTAEIRAADQEQPSGQLEDLTIPWQTLHQKASVFALLSWHGQLSDFGGRTSEMEKLEQWTITEQTISVKFVSGDGGTGKSRLAAEFATSLQKRGWAAGFVDLRKPVTFRLKEAGTLLVVDYPEECPSEVGELLRDLAGLGQASRFRVMFLTRRSIDHWESIIHDSKAAVIVDPNTIALSSVRGTDTYQLFSSAQERTAEKWDTVPLPVSKIALTHWLELAPENNRPLFILAAAVHSALHPDEEIVKYTGREVIEALVERELARLRSTAEKAGFQDHYALARLLCVAAISGGIPQSGLDDLVEKDILGPGVSPGLPLAEKLLRTPV